MPNRSKTSTSKPPLRIATTTRVRRRQSAHARRRDAYNASRPVYWNRLRDRVASWYASLPLPQINPDYISIAGILVAFLFVVAISQGFFFVAWVFLLFHLFLDGLDGAVARATGFRTTDQERQHGRIVDIVSDRAAEGILFIIPPFFVPWFLLFVFNVLVTIISIRTNRACILPLRLAFFLVFTIQLLF